MPARRRPRNSRPETQRRSGDGPLRRLPRLRWRKHVNHQCAMTDTAGIMTSCTGTARRASFANPAAAPGGRAAAWLAAALAALVCLLPSAAAAWPERLVGHGGPVKSVALSADGRHALTGSFDYAIILWALDGDAATVEKRLIGHDAAVNDVQFAGEGRAVSVSDDGSFAIWDLGKGEMTARFKGGGEKVLHVAVSPDNAYAASASWDHTARLYDLAAGTEIAVLEGHRGNVNAVSFSPDGRHLYTGSYDGTVRMWEVPTGRFVRQIYSHGWGINVLAAMPDNKHVMFGAQDGALGLISIAAGDIDKVLPRHERPVLAMTVSADGELAASGGGDGRIKVFSTRDWALEEEFDHPYGPVWGLALTPDRPADPDTLRVTYYAGLDDFVAAWQVAPRKPFEDLEVTVPRRFHQAATDDLGERQFARKCSVCHTLTPDDANRAGPSLYKVFGRKAGTLPGYHYSPALENADIVWNEETIGRLFDEGPDIVTPGSKMPMQRIRTREERDALIAFLKKATETGAALGAGDTN